MKPVKRLLFLCVLLYAGSSMDAGAQNMNSPYSIYGVGDIDHRAYNRTNGMASTGLALPSSFYVIDNNPASLTGLTRSFYLVDLNMVGKSVEYSGDPINAGNAANKDFWIKRFGLAVKLNNHWAGAIGIRQFSNVNYKFYGTKTVEGSAASYNTSYEGDGGLNEYYWTNAYSIGKHFSLGLQSGIIAGSINQSEIIRDENQEIATKQQDYFGQPRFQAGVLYTAALNKKWDASIGGRFTPRVNMIAERSLTVTQNGNAIVEDDFIKNNRFYLPNTYAAGIALKHKKKTTFAVDYTYEDWSSLHIKEPGWQLISSSRLSGGIEFSSQKNIAGRLTETKYFQLGAFVENSYLQIRNTPVSEFGFTAGIGGILGRTILYNISVEAGSRGTTQAKLIKENYFLLTLGLSYRDFLFSKGRKYD